jgi:hypothetical protein
MSLVPIIDTEREEKEIMKESTTKNRVYLFWWIGGFVWLSVALFWLIRSLIIGNLEGILGGAMLVLASTPIFVMGHMSYKFRYWKF